MHVMSFRTRLICLFLTISICISSFGQQRPDDSLRRILSSASLPAQKLELELQLAEAYRPSDPDTVLLYATIALDEAKKLKDKVGSVRARYYIASFHFLTGNPDTAFEIIQNNIIELEAMKDHVSLLAQHNSFGGLCLMKMNRIKEALEHFYTTLKLAEQGDDYVSQLKAKVNMGWAKMELQQYGQAVTDFKEAILVINEKKLTTAFNATIYNNLASSYGSLGKLDSSLKYALVAIDEARKAGNIDAEANGWYILGTAQMKQQKLNEALQSFLAAKPLREKVGDPFYIVSDMAEMAVLYARLKRHGDGILVGKQALKIAEENNINAKLPMIYEALAENYEGAGNFREAADAYKKINELKDSVYADANPKALAEMQAKYETEKKERQIQQQKFHITRQNFLIAIVTGILLLGSLLAYSQYKRFRTRQEMRLQQELLRQQETASRAVIEAEENERQRIAKDLHDSVGQMMSAAKMNLSAFESELQLTNLEQQDSFQKIIQLVDDSCKEVRNVSHNMMPNALLKNNLAAAVGEFVNKLDQNKLKVHLHTEGLDQRLDANIETVLYRVIQECVNNVVKHAQASSLDISLIRDSEGINATIEDNGIGFERRTDKVYDGMGMKNIITRIEYLKGTAEFDTAPGKGTLVALFVPVG